MYRRILNLGVGHPCHFHLIQRPDLLVKSTHKLRVESPREIRVVSSISKGCVNTLIASAQSIPRHDIKKVVIQGTCKYDFTDGNNVKKE